MTVDGTRLQRHLEEMRRGRVAVEHADQSGEADPEIRRVIAAVVAAGEPYGTPQPVWQDAGSADPASLAARLADAIDGEHGVGKLNKHWLTRRRRDAEEGRWLTMR